MVILAIMPIMTAPKKPSTVSVAEAKQHLSELLGRVAFAGETVTIAKRGKPMAKLVPVSTPDIAPRLADAQGWLRDDDPFFEHIERTVAERTQHKPRAYAAAAKAAGRRKRRTQ
jgi:prevent-host-death family protein